MDQRPPLEVADIIRCHGADFLAQYGATLSNAQRRALYALARCRTAALGGHVEQCDQRTRGWKGLKSGLAGCFGERLGQALAEGSRLNAVTLVTDPSR